MGAHEANSRMRTIHVQVVNYNLRETRNCLGGCARQCVPIYANVAAIMTKIVINARGGELPDGAAYETDFRRAQRHIRSVWIQRHRSTGAKDYVARKYPTGEQLIEGGDSFSQTRAFESGCASRPDVGTEDKTSSSSLVANKHPFRLYRRCCRIVLEYQAVGDGSRDE